MALADGLVSYFKMNDNAASTAVDDELDTSEGTANFNTEDRSVAGKIGTALDFEESTSDFVNIGNDASLNTNEITIGAWVKVESRSAEDFFIGKWTPNKYGLGTNGAADKFAAVLRTAAGENRPISSVTFNTGTWYRVLVSWDATEGAKLYVNGVLRGENNDNGGNLSSSAANTVIGALTATPALEFDGVIDAVAFWNRPLTDGGVALDATAGGEIAEDYNGGAGIDYPFSVAPVAAFSGTPLTNRWGENITFTDASTGTPTSWLWDFGDETLSTDQNPTKNYNNNGVFTISLTATNASGSDEEVKTDYITVEEKGGRGERSIRTSYPVINHGEVLSLVPSKSNVIKKERKGLDDGS